MYRCFLNSQKGGRDTKNIISRKQQDKNLKSAVKQELEEYHRQGVDLWLDGSKSTPKEIAKACKIAEEGTYMRDYIANDNGVICQVNFDRIKKK